MNSKILLTGSIFGNVVLACTVGFLMQRPAPATSAVAKETTAETNTQTRFRKSPATTVTNTVVQKFDWRAVESADYKEYIANLRSVGCPEETIRDIIIADVNKLFESRKKEITPTKKFEFWKAGSMFAAMPDEETIKKRQQLAEEKRALLRELLGVEITEPAELAAVANPLTSMLDFLPEEKQSKIAEMMQSFQAKAMKSFQGGAPDAEDMKQMKKVQQEFEAELAKVLTPQEFEDYQLRLSQTSMMMRMQLSSFEPNEQEFRDIFKIRKAFDDEFGMMGMAASTPEERERKKEAEEKSKEQIKNLLGENRYNDYTRASDYNYQQIVKITDRNNIPRDAAIEVYEMEKLAKEQMSKVRSDKTMDPTKRDEVLDAMKKETQNSIRHVLGEQAYQSYTNRPGFRP